MPMSTCDLSIVIVSWNVADLLAACLRAIEQNSRPSDTDGQLRHFGPAPAAATLDVVVVDNASRDGTPARVRADFPWVRLVEAGANLGFTAGNNLGYARSRGRFVFFLNPDTEIAPGAAQLGTGGGDSLWTLYRAVADAPDVVMAGPQLRYGDGTLQSSRRRFPTRWTGFFESTWLGRALPVNPWARRLHMDDWPADFIQDVDWLVGAAMLARRDALEAVRMPSYAGPFDEGFFMYSEEVDLCRRLKDAGGRIVYVPDALVLHYEGRSSEQVVAARHIHFNRSKVRYVHKYFGPGWSELLRRYLLLEFRVQLWLERGKLLLRRQPALRRARIDAYREVLASGLRPTPTTSSQSNN